MSRIFVEISLPIIVSHLVLTAMLEPIKISCLMQAQLCPPLIFTMMIDGQLVFSACVAFASIMFSALMLGGTSDDCGVIQDLAWGYKKLTDGKRVYFGLDKVCQTELGEDGGGWLPLSKMEYSDFETVFGDCEDAGKVAIGFTALLFIFSIVSFFILLRRIKNDTRAAKIQGVVLTFLACMFAIIAISVFGRDCLDDFEIPGDDDGSMDVEQPDHSMWLGLLAAIFLFISALVQLTVDSSIPAPPARAATADSGSPVPPASVKSAGSPAAASVKSAGSPAPVDSPAAASVKSSGEQENQV